MQRPHLIVLLALGWLACNDSIEVTTDITAPENQAAISLTELASCYSDTLPCASCEGIFTELVLFDDSTYFLAESYIGEQNPPFGSFGAFSREGDILILASGEDSTRRFMIQEGRLIQLDKDGSEIVSGLDYSLKQAAQPRIQRNRPFLAAGFLTINTLQKTFQPCGLSTNWELINDNGIKEANRFFAKQGTNLTEGIYVRASIELQSSADSSNASNKVKLNKIIASLANGCQ